MSVLKSMLFLLLLTTWVSCSKDTGEVPSAPEEDNDPSPQPEPQTLAIHPASTAYFSDPFPVQPWITGDTKFFYGTKGNILSGKGPVRENSFSLSGKINISSGILAPYLKDSGIKVKGYWAKNVFRDKNSNWHMVVSARIKKGAEKWTTLVHLKPTTDEKWVEANPITHWTVDRMLVGSPMEPQLANYAGKYYIDGTDLWLIYVRRTPGTKKNGIYAQKMINFKAIDKSTPPRLLLGPGCCFNSEYRNGTTGLKLIETGNLVKIKNKYILAYTVGDYADDNYKLGIAFSDRFLGPYKKILKRDEDNIWGNGAGEPEVEYLLQAQKPRWPHYIRDQVKAPGVPSLNQDKSGNWYLFFAGYNPSEPFTAKHKYRPGHRRPFFVRLRVNIPDKPVKSTSPYTLDEWIKPLKNHTK